MKLNVKKCKYMYRTRFSSTNGFYTMNGAVLEPVNSFKVLKTIFECKFDFKIHITSNVSKTTYILEFIER